MQTPGTQQDPSSAPSLPFSWPLLSLQATEQREDPNNGSLWELNGFAGQALTPPPSLTETQPTLVLLKRGWPSRQRNNERWLGIKLIKLLGQESVWQTNHLWWREAGACLMSCLSLLHYKSTVHCPGFHAATLSCSVEFIARDVTSKSSPPLAPQAHRSSPLLFHFCFGSRLFELMLQTKTPSCAANWKCVGELFVRQIDRSTATGVSVYK